MPWRFAVCGVFHFLISTAFCINSCSIDLWQREQPAVAGGPDDLQHADIDLDNMFILPPAPLTDHLPSIRIFLNESCPGPKSREDVGNRRCAPTDKHPRSEGWGVSRMLPGSGSWIIQAATKHCALGLHYALSPSRFLFQYMCQSYMFGSLGGVENYKRRRQTELKHGRFSMRETMVYVTPETTRKLQGYLSSSAGL